MNKLKQLLIDLFIEKKHLKNCLHQFPNIIFPRLMLLLMLETKF